MSHAVQILGYVAAHAPRFVEELRTLVRFPSVSAEPGRRRAVRACAEWLTQHLAMLGLERARLVETEGHPIVSAEWRGAPGRPTLLVYGHYDVQPPDPIGAWRVPPFAAALEEGILHGRGASDDKGQLFTHLKAIEAGLRTEGALPVNVVCLIEGEEEIGSPHLGAALTRHPLARGVDVAVISDTRMQGRGHPALTYSVRGELKCEIRVTGPADDLHSGHYGGAVHNPIQALCEILTGLHDASGRVSVPGFYDRVRKIGTAERVRLARVAPSDLEVERLAGTSLGWGDTAYSLFERTTIRPALTINGIAGGYAGPGHKAVLPATAAAKLSARLVPDQDPTEIERAFRRHLAQVSPPTVRVSFVRYAGARPVRFEPGHPPDARGRSGLPRRVRHGAGAPSVGRDDPGREHAEGAPRHPDRADGIRPARRPRARAEREVRTGVLLRRYRHQRILHGAAGRRHDATDRHGVRGGTYDRGLPLPRG